MRIRFIGDGDPNTEACEAFGQSFPVGEWVSGEFPSKLLANPTFEVDAADLFAEPTAKPRGRPRKAD